VAYLFIFGLGTIAGMIVITMAPEVPYFSDMLWVVIIASKLHQVQRRNAGGTLGA